MSIGSKDRGPGPLHLYEELLLLALANQTGTLTTYVPQHLVAGAVLAELLIEGRIAVGDRKKQLLEVRDERPSGDPILDEAAGRIAASKRRASLMVWITRVAGANRLHHRAALQLCERGILRADEKTMLLLFRKKIYPELDPRPERKIVERMREALASETEPVDARTAALISLARAVSLLPQVLGKDFVKRRKKRIEQVVKGEIAGKATKELLDASDAFVAITMVAAALVAVISS